ncbi:SGNH/GDSL hydrolase family protein [Psychromonas sp.]|uniref:SGNH/GDSL hydrolase family protein n=1 Tax=Psychromonas sp. TaxID=1884585 RepID=UPI003562978B
MTTILCFGDSNTWGYSPVDGRRYNAQQRWPALLSSLLPSDCLVIEQGQPGRTTFFDDPAAGLVNGNDCLVDCLKQHQPDFIVLMLGTNDLAASFAQSADDISQNAAKIIRKIQEITSLNKQKAASVCLVAPPAIVEVGYFGRLFKGGTEKSKAFSRYYALRAEELGCEFFDAGRVVNSSSIDGIHWEAEQHKKMADKLSIKLKEMLIQENNE